MTSPESKYRNPKSFLSPYYENQIVWSYNQSDILVCFLPTASGYPDAVSPLQLFSANILIPTEYTIRTLIHQR